jgi:PDDEXK-like domain of unknown function (DUF3799)
VSAVLQPTPPAYYDWQEGVELAPGLWRGVPNSLYHGGYGISKSGLDLIAESPLVYKTVKENPRQDTAATLLGTAIHAAVLEPEMFAATYVPDPFPGSRSKEAIAARTALEDAGKVVLKHEPNPETIWDRGDWDAVHFMRDAILRHPEASIFLTHDDGIAELSCYWVDPVTHRLCKCRPDFFNAANNLIIDLKSARDATLSGFARSVHDYRYDVQSAFYTDGMRMAGERVEAMIFIACEKVPPYQVATYEISKEWHRQGRAKYQSNLRTYSDCLRNEEWPGLDDTTRVLEMPGYAKYNPIS